MDTYFLILSVILSILISTLLHPIITNLFSTQKLPPGPTSIPIITPFLWILKSFSDLEPILRTLHGRLGPIVTLRIGPQLAIFISDRTLTHKALIQSGSIFADRPPALATDKIINSNQHSISSAFYGTTWRLLRRNLTSEILHPSRIKLYSHARKWVMEILINRLDLSSQSMDRVRVIDHFQYAMFCLLVLMCFGDKLEENKVKEVEKVQRELIVSFSRFGVLKFWPSLTKILFHKRWDEFFKLKKNQDDVLIPLIEATRKVKQERYKNNSSNKEKESNDDQFEISYVDTLLDLELPHEKRKLEIKEIVSLCSEFLDAGTDTTSTALQWIMANLVKYPEVQKRVYEEIKGVLGEREEKEVREEDLGKLKYLKAVILEGLRRHPPGHFVLPHAVTEDVNLEGFLIPKNGSVNFMVAEMGWDPKIWEDPMAFKPERFLMNGGDEVFDITGSKEIKMMPFGAGRRICPGYGLAILHLEYFVANLVWNFEWNAVDDDEVDLSEKQKFTVVMKNPLQAQLKPRIMKYRG